MAVEGAEKVERARWKGSREQVAAAASEVRAGESDL